MPLSRTLSTFKSSWSFGALCIHLYQEQISALQGPDLSTSIDDLLSYLIRSSGRNHQPSTLRLSFLLELKCQKYKWAEMSFTGTEIAEEI